MTESLLRVRVTMLAWNYAARVLLFPDRATFAFLADFVATKLVSADAAAAALLPELSTDGENFALSIEPIDVRLALGLTIGDPEVVGTFADGLFQIWHGILPS